VWQEQVKLEPPPAVLEEGWFTPTINNGLRGWRLTAGVASHAPPPLKGTL